LSIKTPLFCFLLIAFALQSCKINYSFSGASISPDAKTVSIEYFPNLAEQAQPTISPMLTEALKDRFLSETNLTLVDYNGDMNFEGTITNYTVTPVAIQGNETAALNRLTVSVRVKFTNLVDEKQSFEYSFSRYEDYDSSQDLSAVEEELITSINTQLVDDIFTKAVVNW